MLTQQDAGLLEAFLLGLHVSDFGMPCTVTGIPQALPQAPKY